MPLNNSLALGLVSKENSGKVLGSLSAVAALASGRLFFTSSLSDMVMKSFRDSAVALPAHALGARRSSYLDSLGPLTMPTRHGGMPT